MKLINNTINNINIIKYVLPKKMEKKLQTHTKALSSERVTREV
jgi:hypothetical protein